MKTQTMNHLIQSIHYIRSKYDNNVNFVLAGDVNRTDYADVLDSYGALKQCVTVGTRKEATLEIILSDLINPKLDTRISVLLLLLLLLLRQVRTTPPGF